MAPAGTAMGSLLAIAMPLMMIFTAFRALRSAAQRGRGGVLTPALVLVFLGALSSALALWWEEIILTLPAGSGAWGGGLLPYLAADLLLWMAVWSAIAWVTVVLSRRGGGAA